MANQWFKFYGGEYLSDPKIDRLTPAERSCWVTLMCLASMSNKNGLIEFVDERTLLKKSGVEQDIYGDDNTYDNTKGVINKFQSMNMLVQIDVNTIQLNNWDKRQTTSMTGYERVKKYRENKKKVGNDNEMITSDNVNDNIRIDKNRKEENTNTIQYFLFNKNTQTQENTKYFSSSVEANQWAVRNMKKLGEDYFALEVRQK